MREAIGDGALAGFAFFQPQALVIALFAASFVAAASAPGGPASPAVWLALAIWIVAVGGEWLADRQLHVHRRDPAEPPSAIEPAAFDRALAEPLLACPVLPA